MPQKTLQTSCLLLWLFWSHFLALPHELDAVNYLILDFLNVFNELRQQIIFTEKNTRKVFHCWFFAFFAFIVDRNRIRITKDCHDNLNYSVEGDMVKGKRFSVVYERWSWEMGVPLAAVSWLRRLKRQPRNSVVPTTITLKVFFLWASSVKFFILSLLGRYPFC